MAMITDEWSFVNDMAYAEQMTRTYGFTVIVREKTLHLEPIFRREEYELVSKLGGFVLFDRDHGTRVINYLIKSGATFSTAPLDCGLKRYNKPRQVSTLYWTGDPVKGKIQKETLFIPSVVPTWQNICERLYGYYPKSGDRVLTKLCDENMPYKEYKFPYHAQRGTIRDDGGENFTMGIQWENPIHLSIPSVCFIVDFDNGELEMGWLPYAPWKYQLITAN